VWRIKAALAIPRSAMRELKGRFRPRFRNRVKIGFFENEPSSLHFAAPRDEKEEDFAARTTLRACRKVILRYNAHRLWRKTSRQTKTA
jgi:hypothetical protein